MEISKGMYIRTKKGIIRKWSEYDVLIKEWEDRFNYNDEDGDLNFVFEDGIAKYSNNIIDLIEVGDYVNRYCVLDFETLQTGEKAVIVDGLINYGWGQGVIPASEIKEVVTKERFNACKYVVERDD